jgi:hypothetical protein
MDEHDRLQHELGALMEDWEKLQSELSSLNDE